MLHRWRLDQSRFGKTVDVNNPATNEVLGTIPNLGADETRRAIEAANAAWRAGARRPPRSAPTSCANGST